MSVVSTANSSTSALAASAIFTGTSADVLLYEGIAINVKTDVPGTLYADFSSDGTNFDHVVAYPLTAASTPGYNLTVHPSRHARYMRTRYVNGDTAQTLLRIQTIFHAEMTDARVASATGGALTHKDLDVNSTAAAVSTAACKLMSASLCNSNISNGVFFKAYDLASPTVGSDTPFMTVRVPAGQTLHLHWGAAGIDIANRLHIAGTGAIADSDTTPLSTNDLSVSLQFVE